MCIRDRYEGIRETLEALRDMGIKNAVLTNKPDALAHSLTRQFFGGLMEACIGQTPQTISKPDPRSMDRVLDTLHVQCLSLIHI